MKNMLKVEKIFLVYSVINLLLTWVLTGNNYFANEKLAFGLGIFYVSVVYFYFISSFIFYLRD